MIKRFLNAVLLARKVLFIWLCVFTGLIAFLIHLTACPSIKSIQVTPYVGCVKERFTASAACGQFDWNDYTLNKQYRWTVLNEDEEIIQDTGWQNATEPEDFGGLCEIPSILIPEDDETELEPGDYTVKFEIRAENKSGDKQTASETDGFYVYEADYVLITVPAEDICIVGTNVYSSDIHTKQCEAIAYWSGFNGIKEDGEGDDLECFDHKIKWSIESGGGSIDENGLYTADSEPGKSVIVAKGSMQDKKEIVKTEVDVINPCEGDQLELGHAYEFKAEIKGGTNALHGKWNGHILEINNQGNGNNNQGQNVIVVKNEKTVDKISTSDVTINKCGDFEANCYVMINPNEGTGIEDPKPPKFTVVNKNMYSVQLGIRESPEEENQDNDVICVSNGEEKNKAELYVKLIYDGNGDGEKQTVNLSVVGNDAVQLSKNALLMQPGKTKKVNIESGDNASSQKDDIIIKAKIGQIIEDTEDFSIVGTEFDQAPVKTGYDIPNTNTIFKEVIATVTPALFAGDVKFSTGGKSPDRATVTIEGNPDINTGKVTLKVYGKDKTPKEIPKGDTELIAKYDKDVCGKVNIIVVVPSKVGEPHPECSEIIEGKNVALNINTVPIAPSIPSNRYFLCTIYGKTLYVPVLDQFGESLDKVYKGIHVEELISKEWHDINVVVNADGKYPDFVGSSYYDENIPSLVFANDSEKINNWINNSKPYPVDEEEDRTDNLNVRIGGHELNPSIKNRTVKIFPVGTTSPTVKIIWP